MARQFVANPLLKTREVGFHTSFLVDIGGLRGAVDHFGSV